MPTIVIRDARPGDRDLIVAYNQRLARETEQKDLDASVLWQGVTLALEYPDRLRYWVAETSDPDPVQVVGQAAITREWSDWRAGWIWWFQSVYVHPDFRGQGVFRRLHTAIREVAHATPDVIGLRLYVEAHNDRARQVYQTLGLGPSGYEVFEEIWPARA